MRALKLKYLFLFFLFLNPVIAQDSEEPVPPPAYPDVDERFLEELKKQDQEQEVVGETRFARELFYMLFVLGMIVATLLLISWALKKMMHSRVQQANLTNLIKVLERRDLTQKSALYLVEISGQGYLVGESPQGLAHLGPVDLEKADVSFEQLMNEQK